MRAEVTGGQRDIAEATGTGTGTESELSGRAYPVTNAPSATRCAPPEIAADAAGPRRPKAPREVRAVGAVGSGKGAAATARLAYPKKLNSPGGNPFWQPMSKVSALECKRYVAAVPAEAARAGVRV